ncbi:MAG: AAA family ATPase [Candidatus Omnitrophica bacterium]|nr:AAA family ATPase [Candidatus Omnitrophota bacterium]
MSYTIAVAGKGGTGKTTLAAFIVDYLRKNKKGSLLAVDADPNSTLNECLGLALKGTVVGILDKIAAMKNGLPSGMTKDRYIEYEVQDSLSEGEGFDLLAMGRPEGPGCYCYANTVLRGVIERLSKGYDFVVIDNEAGMEHLSRRTARQIDCFFIISDFSRIGIRSARRISDLAGEMEIKIGKKYLIVNMAPEGSPVGATGGIENLKGEIAASGLELAGVVPFEKNIEDLALAGKPVIGSRENEEINKIFKETIEG